MANSSDLVAPSMKAEPAWYDAFARSSGFVEQIARTGRTARSTETLTPDRIEEARLQGYAEGLAEAERLLAEDTAAREQLGLAMTRLDNAARTALRQHLAETLARLCEQVIEPHLVNAEALATRCAALVDAIGEAPQHLVLHLHPDDAAMLDHDTENSWRISRDPEMERGALRLEGPEGSMRDGPEEWRRAIAAALEA